MALKDYALEKGEGLQAWEGRPARELSRPAPVDVSWGPPLGARGQSRGPEAAWLRHTVPGRHAETRGRRRASDGVREKSGGGG